MNVEAIHCYLRAREDEIAAFDRGEPLYGAMKERESAWSALETGLFTWIDARYADFSVTPAEDEFVFLPLLTEEMGGNVEAAKAAWFLGARPREYPERHEHCL